MARREKVLYVVATWDDGAQVWIAQSKDVPGLCIEAASPAELQERLKTVIPELLSLNLLTGACPPVELLLRGQSHLQMAC